MERPVSSSSASGARVKRRVPFCLTRSTASARASAWTDSISSHTVSTIALKPSSLCGGTSLDHCARPPRGGVSRGAVEAAAVPRVATRRGLVHADGLWCLRLCDRGVPRARGARSRPSPRPDRYILSLRQMSARAPCDARRSDRRHLVARLTYLHASCTRRALR